MHGNPSSTNFYEEYAPSFSLVDSRHDQTGNYQFSKRMIDVIFSLICLPIVLVIIGIFSILIRLETPGPAIYYQVRVGYYGQYFKVYKLRSMFLDAEKNGATWALENDPRVTKVGRFMRKTRIDELPQIINILKGEMTLVGPRPERPIFTAEFEKSIPGFTKRLLVKPGLTGLAQVNGGYNLSPEKKLLLDLYYIENKGIKMDLKILVKTIEIICSGNGSR
ncbi:sugar transferase [Paucisalibacillus globulus]|uniref:sugar transferase n=1 Tax=Paucisalibacillus globulus TaxID=351095 RepID=UPI0004091177